jgi:hypothetical protein
VSTGSTTTQPQPGDTVHLFQYPGGALVVAGVELGPGGVGWMLSGVRPGTTKSERVHVAPGEYQITRTEHA